MKPGRDESQAQILRLLSEFSPLSHLDVAEFLGLRKKTAALRLRIMWDEKTLHIDHYKRNHRGLPIPFYSIGRHVDAPPIPKMTAAEKMRRYKSTAHGKAMIEHHNRINNGLRKQRIKEDAEYAELHRKRQREWLRKKKGYSSFEFRSHKVLDEIAMQFGTTWRFSNERPRQNVSPAPDSQAG